VAICHDARKGRYTGSHWSKPVAPLLHSTGISFQDKLLSVMRYGFGGHLERSAK
jgi:hypothetical protein